MEYYTIIDPKSGSSYSIHSKDGRALLKHFVNELITHKYPHIQTGGWGCVNASKPIQPPDDFIVDDSGVTPSKVVQSGGWGGFTPLYEED